MKPSPIRDLVRQIDLLARNHPAYSQVRRILDIANDHMSAIAYIEEQRTVSSSGVFKDG